MMGGLSWNQEPLNHDWLQIERANPNSTDSPPSRDDHHHESVITMVIGMEDAGNRITYLPDGKYDFSYRVWIMGTRLHAHHWFYIFSFPLVFLFVWLRRPKLKHILSAFVEGGQTITPITDNRVLHTSVPTRFAHHPIRDSPPVELPPARTLWTIFFVTVFVSNWGFSSSADYRSSSCDIAGNSRCTGMVGWI